MNLGIKKISTILFWTSFILFCVSLFFTGPFYKEYCEENEIDCSKEKCQNCSVCYSEKNDKCIDFQTSSPSTRGILVISTISTLGVAICSTCFQIYFIHREREKARLIAMNNPI